MIMGAEFNYVTFADKLGKDTIVRQFIEGEFVGLTVPQAHALRHRKDVAYLQS